MTATQSHPRYTRESSQNAHLSRLVLPPVHELVFTFSWGSMGHAVEHNADPTGPSPLMDFPQLGATWQGDGGDKNRFARRLITSRKVLEIVLRAHKCAARVDAKAQLIAPVGDPLVLDFAKEVLGALPVSSARGEQTMDGEEIMDFVFEWNARQNRQGEMK